MERDRIAGAPLIATDLEITLRCGGDRNVGWCHPNNYRITSSKSRWTNEKHDAYLDSLERSFIQQLSHSMRSSGGQTHEGCHGYNSCTGAGGISRDPDQASYAKDDKVNPEIIESRRDRADEGRHSDMLSILQHSLKPCHASSPCGRDDFCEHSGQNF